MDEILIGEKKYVSSKRAAKMTGYAKDYIGQLCREGRVPARLVGRSWYVLESAINDHRFGEEKTEKEIQQTQKESPVFLPTWESPHYEASSAEALPSINRLQNHDTGLKRAEEGPSDVSQHLQDSWKDWFDRISNQESAAPAPTTVPESSVGGGDEGKEVRVPVHAIYHHPPKELLPHHNMGAQFAEEEREEREETVERVEVEKKKVSSWGRRILAPVQMVGAVIAIVFAFAAVIGSGRFDTYVISNSQVQLIAGVSLYNR